MGVPIERALMSFVFSDGNSGRLSSWTAVVPTQRHHKFLGIVRRRPVLVWILILPSLTELTPNLGVVHLLYELNMLGRCKWNQAKVKKVAILRDAVLESVLPLGTIELLDCIHKGT
jgi:hypothetical protein